MTDLKISTLTPEHARLLQSIWSSSFEAAYKDVHTEDNIAAYCDVNFTPEAALKTLQDPLKLCKLAGSEHAPLGYYVLHDHPCPLLPDVRACELKQIYLLPDAYGMGVGKTLFEDALQEAQALGANTMWLSVSDKNFRAQCFYQKLGFYSVGRGPDFHVGTDLLTSQILTLQID